MLTYNTIITNATPEKTRNEFILALTKIYNVSLRQYYKFLKDNETNSWLEAWRKECEERFNALTAYNWTINKELNNFRISLEFFAMALDVAIEVSKKHELN